MAAESNFTSSTLTSIDRIAPPTTSNSRSSDALFHDSYNLIKRHKRLVEATESITTNCKIISSPPSPKKKWQNDWNQITKYLVRSSTIPFIVLLVPQVIRNAINMANGNSSALSILSWMGFMSSLLGNTILLSYFMGKGERSAALVQTIGVGSNFVMLTQIYISGYLTSSIFWSISLFTAFSCFVNSAGIAEKIYTGFLRHNIWKFGPDLWKLWESILSIIGLGYLIQVLCYTFIHISSPVPGIAASILAISLCFMDKYKLIPAKIEGLWVGLHAWTATLLFAFQPIGQLVCNFTDPSSIQGLSIGTVILAMLGNALMLPRALYIRDNIWLTGTLWGTLMMGWAQLLSMFVGRTESGSRYLGPSSFSLITILLFSYILIVFFMDSQCYRN